MGAMKNMNYEIESFILEHRELAENDPLNLIGENDMIDDLYSLMGSEKAFVNYVWKVLDQNE